jgi:predicted MarR family transcription regulator
MDLHPIVAAPPIVARHSLGLALDLCLRPFEFGLARNAFDRICDRCSSARKPNSKSKTKFAILHELERTTQPNRRKVETEEVQLEVALQTVQNLEQELKQLTLLTKTERAELSKQ